MHVPRRLFSKWKNYLEGEGTRGGGIKRFVRRGMAREVDGIESNEIALEKVIAEICPHVKLEANFEMSLGSRCSINADASTVVRIHEIVQTVEQTESSVRDLESEREKREKFVWCTSRVKGTERCTRV